MAKWRSMLLGGVISAVCIYLLLGKVDLARTGESFAQANVYWILASLPVSLTAIVIRCWRWQLLFLPDDRVSLRGMLAGTMIGYMFNTVLPGRVGELARASLVSQTERVSTARAFGTIVVEKILDVLVLLIGLASLAAFVPLPPLIAAGGITAGIVLVVVAVPFFIFARARSGLVGLVERITGRVPVLRRLQLPALIEMVLSAASSLGVPHLLVAQAFISIILWGCAYGTVAMVIKAFGIELPWTAAALLLIATNLGMTVPSAPAYVGVYHAIAVLALSLFGVDGGQALSAAVALHALGFGTFMIGGAAVLMAGLARHDYQVSDLWRWQITVGSPAGTQPSGAQL